MTHYEKVQESAAYIREQLDFETGKAILTGTGQDALIESFDVVAILSYKAIPHFPVPTVESHTGSLFLVKAGEQEVLLFSGRFHYYEGYSMDEVTYPIRVMQELGIQEVYITNAVGSVDPAFPEGSVALIKDHINLHPENPLRGENIEAWGDRFPEMINAYNKDLRVEALKVADQINIPLKEAVYVGTQGPNLETPAEYRFFSIIGGNVVGMSTIPEVIVCSHASMKCLVLSITTNLCYPFEEIQSTTVAEIIQVANQATPKVGKLLSELLKQ